ncbi:MAG: hypothetical protein ACPL0A_02360 [Candidatus Micrarchaeia archaeon]
MMNLRPAILCALFALSLAYAVDQLPQAPFDQNIYTAGAIGVVIGFIIAALGYMVASIIGTPQAMSWAKNEVYENFYTLFLVSNVIVLALAVDVFFVMSGAPQPTYDKLVDSALSQVDMVLYGNYSKIPEDFELGKIDETNNAYMNTSSLGLTSLFMRAYAFETAITEMTYITHIAIKPLVAGATSEGGGGIGAVGTPSIDAPMFPGLSKVSDVIESINELILILILILIVQKGVLLFIKFAGPIIFLTGVLFRSLPITRRLGSTLIAIFITMQFIYPAFLSATLSDSFYGKMVGDFSGVYVNVDWLAGLPATGAVPVQFVGPSDIVIVDDKVKKDGINFSFVGLLVSYNYSVVDERNNKICKGSSTYGEQINCTISYSRIPTPDDLNKKNELTPHFYNITLSFYGVERGLEGISPAQYKYALDVPVYFIKPCDSAECEQTLLVKNEESKEIRNAYIAEQQYEEIDDLYAPGVAGDVLTATGKLTASYLAKRGFEKVTRDVVERVGKTGLKGALGKIAGAPVGIVSFILSSATIKSDISTFIFDEIACDAYSGHMAKSYLGEPLYKQPEVSDSTWMYSIANAIKEGGEFIGSAVYDIYDQTFKMYGESDYTSCASSTGLFNKMLGTVLPGDIIESPREFNVTILFSRAIFIFMISFFSIVISVTFFRSIAENIGGDSSLMGLGKLI